MDREALVRFVAQQQNNNESFSGDPVGEMDTRFSYCVLMCLVLP